MKNGEKSDAHSDARGDSQGARNDTTLPPGNQSHPSDSSQADSPAAATHGLAVIASAWGKLSAPIRDAVLGIVADAIGHTIQLGLVSIAAAWAKLQPAVREAILAIVADALSASTTTAPPPPEPAFTRGTFSVGELLGSGSEN